VTLPKDLVAYATAAAAPFKAKWPEGLKTSGGAPVLEHEFDITKAKELLA
jgi:hypothetical protein